MNAALEVDVPLVQLIGGILVKRATDVGFHDMKGYRAGDLTANEERFTRCGTSIRWIGWVYPFEER